MIFFSKYDKSFGYGLVYGTEKMEKLMTGSNQDWYNFKRTLIDHITCSSIRSSGQVHLKAKQFAVKEKKKIAKSVEINTNLVATAMTVNKNKGANSSYETTVALMSFSGANIGDIGHGR